MNNRNIRKRFNEAKDWAKGLRVTIKEDYDDICPFALSTDVSNLTLEYENIIDELLKRKT